MNLLALAIIAGLSTPPSPEQISNRHDGFLVAGICVGSAAECLADVIDDGALSASETARPFVLLITFDYNSSLLTTAAKLELAAVAKVLNDPRLLRTTLIVEGHTDSKGRQRYNFELSQRRAEVVAQYLATMGVDSSRLSAIGRGETQPRVSVDPEAPENRRVELRLNLL